MRLIPRMLMAGALTVASLATAVEKREAHALSPAFGWLDDVTVWADNTATVRGWAMTSDYPSAALGVRVRVDGALYYFPASNYRLANQYRPDVGSAYPGYGNWHGFSFLVPLPGGWHNVCIEAQNSGVYNVISGCLNVNVNGAPNRFLGGLWAKTPTTVTDISWNTGGTWASNIQNGVSAWGNAATFLNTPFVAAGAANVSITVANYESVMGEGYGLTGFDPWSPNITSTESPIPWWNRTYTHNNIWINSQADDLLFSSALRDKVAAHEFGHALGFAHPPNAGVPTVMTQGPIDADTSGSPSTFDVATVNNAYQ